MSVRELDPVRTADGRRLDLCEVGDPQGTVAFYLHGTGSSRLEAALYDEAAARHGVRLVSWNRPGTGGSTEQPGRRLLDVVGDAREVAAAVGAERPVAVGLSGGGSHVLALVAAGSEVVRGGVAINAGPPPEDDILADLPGGSTFSIKLARDRPKVFDQLGKAMESQRGPVSKLLQQRLLDPLDLAVIRDARLGPLFEAAAAEGRAQPRAYTKEALMLWGQPWGFSVDRFEVPLHVFAGRHDPFRVFGLWLAAHGAVLHRFDGGHISGFAAAAADETMRVVAEL